MTEIRPATEAELPVVARVFGEAFIDDQMLRWPFPPDCGIADLKHLFAILLDVYWPLDAVWVTDDLAGGGRVAPPGRGRAIPRDRGVHTRI